MLVVLVDVVEVVVDVLVEEVVVAGNGSGVVVRIRLVVVGAEDVVEICLVVTVSPPPRVAITMPATASVLLPR